MSKQRTQKQSVHAARALYIPSRTLISEHDLTDPADLTVERAIELSQPMQYGQRNQAIFQLCRNLKAIPELRRADLDTLQPIVRKWHKLALPQIRTKDFAETWED